MLPPVLTRQFAKVASATPRHYLRMIGLMLPCALVLTWSAVAAAQSPDPLPLHEQIDQLLAAGWQQAGITPAELTSDEEFQRRVYLDLTGTIPPLGEARTFLDDTSPSKRQQLVDRLLNSPEYARHMQQTFDVILMERRPSKHVPDAAWREYLRQSFAANKPWNQLAREILSADGVDPALRPASRFVLDREVEPNLLARDVGRLFLGRDMQCAQCHDHPLVGDYLQVDYYGLFAFFSRSYIVTGKDDKIPYLAEKGDGDVTFKSVFIANSDASTGPHLPGAAAIAEPQFEKGQEYEVAPAEGVRAVPKFSRRAQLPRLLPEASTVAFSRNMANRLWLHMFGRGLFHPPDMDHSDNRPLHPAVLDLLTQRFTESDFDIKAMLRELALTKAYRLSISLPAGVPEPPPQQFAVAQLRQLTAEQLAASLMQATGLTDAERIALGPELTEATLQTKLVGHSQPLVNTFAGPAGQPEADFQATLEQTLFVAHGGTLQDWLNARPGSLSDGLAKIAEPAPLAEQLYLRVLSRRPTAEETAEVQQYLTERAADRGGALRELAWALLASTEFRFNH